MILNNVKKYLILMRINNPTGFFLLLWPNLSTLVLANKTIPSIKIFFVFILGTFLMRSAGCIINDYIDRDIDDKVQRTKYRPLVIGIVTKKQAIFLFFILILISFFLLICNLDKINIYFCFLCFFCTILYPLMKKIFLPQLFLGLTFSLSIFISWLSIKSSISISCIILFLINFFWTISYDTQYALIDFQYDIKIGVKSTAVFFKNNTIFFIGLLHIIILLFLIILGIKENLNIFYWIILLLIMIMFFYQIKLVFKKKYLKAFLNNNYIGILLFVSFIMNTKNFVNINLKIF